MVRLGAWLERPAIKRRSRRIADLLAADATAVGVYLGAPDSPEARALAAALAPATVRTVPTDERARHLLLAAGDKVDFIVDSPEVDGRLARFTQTFFHLRPGGRYVVPGGAGELGTSPGPLGELLADAAQAPPVPLRTPVRHLRDALLRAVRNHVSSEADGEDLVLSHDLDDVLVKIREENLNAFIEGGRSRHRVVSSIAPATPPVPDFRDLPVEGQGQQVEPIEDVELYLRDYRDVVVRTRQIVIDGRLILPDSYRHFRADRLRNNGLVDLTHHFAVLVKPLPAELPYLSGTFLHFDNEARGHFGHLLTESISRTWTWSEALAIDPDVRVLVNATPKRPQLLDYEVAIYEACGIPRDRIILLDAPVRVERLLSGTPMFSNPHFVHARIAETWDAIGDRLAAGASDRQWPRRLFLGRRETRRACANAPELEAEFTSRGFEVVHPEDHPLGDQVQMFRQAEVIAGYAGSGMFQIAFVAEPKQVIQVTSDRYRPRNELLIAAVRGHRLDRIRCVSEEVDEPMVKAGLKVGFRYDPDREGPAIEELLAEADGVELVAGTMPSGDRP